MKRIFLASVALITLSGCASNASQEHELSYLLKNPLFAERYAEALVDAMVELEIYEDPILEDEDKKSLTDATKEQWLEVAQKAVREQRKGAKGSLIAMKEYVAGEVLYLNDMLYLGPEFFTTPGPSLHFFITKAVDPRDVQFPDVTAKDIGSVRSNVGVSQYSVPSVENPLEYRTIVLWDTKLERLYGFAQMSPLYE